MGSKWVLDTLKFQTTQGWLEIIFFQRGKSNFCCHLTTKQISSMRSWFWGQRALTNCPNLAFSLQFSILLRVFGHQSNCCNWESCWKAYLPLLALFVPCGRALPGSSAGPQIRVQRGFRSVPLSSYFSSLSSFMPPFLFPSLSCPLFLVPSLSLSFHCGVWLSTSLPGCLLWLKLLLLMMFVSFLLSFQTERFSSTLRTRNGGRGHGWQ